MKNKMGMEGERQDGKAGASVSQQAVAECSTALLATSVQSNICSSQKLGTAQMSISSRQVNKLWCIYTMESSISVRMDSHCTQKKGQSSANVLLHQRHQTPPHTIQSIYIKFNNRQNQFVMLQIRMMAGVGTRRGVLLILVSDQASICFVKIYHLKFLYFSVLCYTSIKTFL